MCSFSSSSSSSSSLLSSFSSSKCFVQDVQVENFSLIEVLLDREGGGEGVGGGLCDLFSHP